MIHFDPSGRATAPALKKGENMGRFYAEIQGSRGSATRKGTKNRAFADTFAGGISASRSSATSTNTATTSVKSGSREEVAIPSR